PLGATGKAFGEAFAARSITTRNAPLPCSPRRICLMYPWFVGSDRGVLPALVDAISTTTRSGVLSVSVVNSAGPDKSNTTRVASGPAQTRTSFMVTPAAAGTATTRPTTVAVRTERTRRRLSTGMVRRNLTRDTQGFQ